MALQTRKLPPLHLRPDPARTAIAQTVFLAYSSVIDKLYNYFVNHNLGGEFAEDFLDTRHVRVAQGSIRSGASGTGLFAGVFDIG